MRAPAVLFLVAMSLACSPQAAEPMARDRATGCRFVRPAALKWGSVCWLGGCPRGLASGPAALGLSLPGGRPVLYLGAIAAGGPRRGVIVKQGDYIVAPRCNGDRPVQSEEMQDNLDALNAAADAARRVSRRFAAQGNRASAAWYAAEAKRLEETLDH